MKNYSDRVRASKKILKDDTGNPEYTVPPREAWEEEGRSPKNNFTNKGNYAE